MVNLLFSGYLPQKNMFSVGGAIGGPPVTVYREHMIERPDMETCFQSIEILIEEGWKLENVKVFDQNERQILDLSRNILKGEPILRRIERIEQERRGEQQNKISSLFNRFFE